MFKATEVKRKLREINLRIDMQMNLSSCKTSPSFQRLSWDLLGTKNVSSAHAQNFWKVNKSWWRKRCNRNHIVSKMSLCLPQIIQTSSLELKMYHLRLRKIFGR